MSIKSVIKYKLQKESDWMTPGEFQHDQIDKSGIILKLIYQAAINFNCLQLKHAK